MPEFGMVTQVEEKHISRGQIRPYPKGRGGSVSQISETSYMRAHSMRETATKFFMVIKLHVRKTCTRMLMRDVFAVTNLLV